MPCRIRWLYRGARLENSMRSNFRVNVRMDTHEVLLEVLYGWASTFGCTLGVGEVLLEVL